MKRILFLTIAAAALSVFAAGPASAAQAKASEPTRTVRGEWVGRVAGTDAYIAISVGPNGKVRAYLCDGKRGRRAKTYAWFNGKANGNRVSLRSKGIHLRADLRRGWPKGTITLANGRTFSFDARPARGTAGLYRVQTLIRGVKVVGGWIHLNDGSVRGQCSGCAPKAQAALVEEEAGNSGGSGGNGGVTPVPPSEARENPCAGTACDNLSCQQLSNMFDGYQLGFQGAKTKQLKELYVQGMIAISRYMLGRGCG